MSIKHHIKYTYFVILPQLTFAVEKTTKGGLVDATQTMVGKIRATITTLVTGLSAIAFLCGQKDLG
ncbi:MAG: hypothetical protein GKC53_03525 [Neisseriaceae bacterium]|nr:MAG: hypothetical protein GKC53_03525 [Neisseriaceae bacterium]